MYGETREVLCRKWSLEILQFLAEEGTHNYNEIEAEFDTSSDIISSRLQHLSSVGVIIREKKSHKDVRYSITPDGKQVLKLLDEIQRSLDE